MEIHLIKFRPGRIARSNDKVQTIHLVIYLDLVVEKVQQQKTARESEETNPESGKINLQSGKTNRVYTDLNRVSLLQVITRHNADQAQTTQNQQTKRSAEHLLDSKQSLVVIVAFFSVVFFFYEKSGTLFSITYENYFELMIRLLRIFEM